MKKIIRCIVSLLTALTMLAAMPAQAFAANWDPDDEVRITVRVYDKSNFKEYIVGKDSVKKGDKYYEANGYQIPELTKFVDQSQFGYVIEVLGPWKLGGSKHPRAFVEWSSDFSDVTMTYYVNKFTPDTSGGSGSGSGSDVEPIDPDTIDLGGTGDYTLKFTINYHSNYPDGTDVVKPKTYQMKYRSSSFRWLDSSKLKSYTEMGFSYYGYEPKEKDMFGQDKVWYDSKAASKTVMFVIENGKTYNAYAAWKEIPVTKTIRYYDGEELLKEQTFTAGTAVTIGGMTKTIEGKEFKGWATTAGGDVVYQAGDTPTLDDDLNLYAVWEDVKPDVEQVTITYHDGDKIVDTQTVDKGTKVTVLDLLQTRTVRTFLGWATEPEGEAVYKPGKELTVYENMDLYAVWKVEEENPNPEDPEKTSLPSMEKKILVTNGEETTEHDEISGMPGDTVEFVLKSNVPQNLFAYVTDWTKTDGKVHADGKYDLDIHDDLDGKYVIDMDTVAVKIGGVPLGKDFYTVSSGDELDGHGVESHVCDFHVTLDLIDLFNKEQLFETDVRNATPITVTYSAKLQESVGNGAHCNYAWVTYPDGTGVIDPSKILIDSALVHVFDLKIVKSDSADDKKFLGGAEFELRDSNTKDAKVLASGITAENTGELDFKNLVAGTYYLYETKAPTGYICMTDPIEVTIAVGADGNHVITKTVTNGKAPSTGGTGTMIYIVAGAVLTSAAFAVLAARKKEQNA